MSFGRMGAVGGFGRTGKVGGGASQYLGQVATRSVIPQITGFNSGLAGIMTRSSHTSRDAISSLKLVYTNWYVDGPNGTEVNTGGTQTLRVGVEYPSGTFTQILFSGIVAGSNASGGTLISDALSISIPANTQFWIRTQQLNASGVMYIDGRANSALGDRLSFDTTDKSISGVIDDGLPAFSYAPALILGATKKRSFYLIGTSRTFGLQDVVDASGDIGVLARSIGPNYAYCNAGIPNDSAVHFKTNNTKRLALLPYFSDVIVEHGVNDDQATIQASLATIYPQFAGKRLYGVTISPYTSGAWTAVDGSDQTLVLNVTALNTFIRTKPSPLRGYFDIASVTMSSLNSNKWKADGTAAKYTSDGLHENQFSNLLIQSSAVIAP